MGFQMSSGDYAEDVVFADERIFLVTELHLRAAVFGQEDLVAVFHLERYNLAVLRFCAGAERGHFRLLRFFFGAIGNDDTVADLLFLLDVLNKDSIADGSNLEFRHREFGLVTRSR